MSLFIGNAYAEGAAQQQSALMQFLPLIALVLIFYFLLIRPQQKRAKQHQAMVSAIKKGDKIVTNSGIIGTVVKIVSDQEVLVEVSDKVVMTFVKSAIATVVNPTAMTPATPATQITKSKTKSKKETADKGKK